MFKKVFINPVVGEVENPRLSNYKIKFKSGFGFENRKLVITYVCVYLKTENQKRNGKKRNGKKRKGARACGRRKRTVKLLRIASQLDSA